MRDGFVYSVLLHSTVLVIGYFGALLGGAGSHGAALRQAKLEMIAGERYAAPVYWSAFILVGG